MSNLRCHDLCAWHDRCDFIDWSCPLLSPSHCQYARVLPMPPELIAGRSWRRSCRCRCSCGRWPAWACGWSSASSSGLPDDNALRGIGSMSRATTVLDASDATGVHHFQGTADRSSALARLAPLISAIVAVEDQRFFDHGGVDVIRVAGAAWKNVRDGWGTQGGSTITQQLARQSFLTREKTVTPEAHRNRGGRAARAGVHQEPDPRAVFEQGLLRRRAVRRRGGLARLLRQACGRSRRRGGGAARRPGQGAVDVCAHRQPARAPRPGATRRSTRCAPPAPSTSRRCATAKATSVELHDTLRGQETFGQYFKEEVRKELVRQFGWARVYEGGLKVYTTLDLNMQKAAEAEVQRAVAEIEKQQARRGKRDAGARRRAAAGRARGARSAHRRGARDGRRPQLR